MSISSKDLQSELRDRGFYRGTLDGIEGPQTITAINSFLQARSKEVSPTVLASNDLSRRRLAVCQLIFKDLRYYHDNIDGLMGPNTRYAIELWQNRTRQQLIPPRPMIPNNRWPKRSQLESFYGPVGTGHTRLTLPFPMKLAWDLKTTINAITIHSKCSESLNRILSEILRTYGHEQIQRLRIDLFGGTYANRNIRGGNVLSVHAYAAAIDLDPENNQLRWGADRATFAQPVYKPMFDAFRKEGWTSLGEERGFDFMHLEAAIL